MDKNNIGLLTFDLGLKTMLKDGKGQAFTLSSEIGLLDNGDQ